MSYARTVLVIDDESVVCHSCQKVLEEEGFDVSVATSGRDGIEKLTQQDFDAVLVDLKMPGVGGMDVLRTLRRTKPDTRAIIITAHSSVASAVEAMQLGAADYLPKPFTPKELTERISLVLQPADTRLHPETKEVALPHERIAVPESEQVTEERSAEARILLAGSDIQEMASLRECLSSEPWQVRTVERHEEIIEMIRAGQVDVLVTGVDVLGTKVYDLIPEVKNLGSDIPTIVACADPSLDLARKIREFGIFYFLVEPFDPEEVRAAVRDAVRKAAMVQRQVRPERTKIRLVRSVRTVAKNGKKVSFVTLGESVDENSRLYREIVGELKRRSVPMHVETAHQAVAPREFPRYLAQDHRVVIIAPVEGGGQSGEVVNYSASKFEKRATKEQQRSLREVAYPEVMLWLRAQGIAPEIRIVCLPGQRLETEQACQAAKIIMKEGLA